MLRLLCTVLPFIITVAGAGESLKSLTPGSETTLRTLPRRQADVGTSWIFTASAGSFPAGSGILPGSNVLQSRTQASTSSCGSFPSINILPGAGIYPSVPGDSPASLPSGTGIGVYAAATGTSNQRLWGTAPTVSSLYHTAPGTGPAASYPTAAAVPICELQ